MTAVTDAGGNVYRQYYYDPYGNIIKVLDGSGNAVDINNDSGFNHAYTYRGYRYDQESGLYFLNARYYAAGIGRFLTKDTFKGRKAEPQSLNRFAYAQGDPINLVDYSGHDVGAAGLDAIDYSIINNTPAVTPLRLITKTNPVLPPKLRPSFKKERIRDYVSMSLTIVAKTFVISWDQHGQTFYGNGISAGVSPDFSFSYTGGYVNGGLPKPEDSRQYFLGTSNGYGYGVGLGYNAVYSGSFSALEKGVVSPGVTFFQEIHTSDDWTGIFR